jgi:hypothetical protein
MSYKILIYFCLAFLVTLICKTTNAASPSKSALDENIDQAIQMEAFHLRARYEDKKTTLQSGIITGEIRDAVSSTPLKDVEVDIWDTSGKLVNYAFTNSNGIYTVTGIPTGDYYAVSFTPFSHSGYIDEVYNNIYCMGGSGSCDVTIGDSVAVIDGQTTTGIDFSLDHGGTISGVVTDADHNLAVYHTHIFNDHAKLVGFGLRDVYGNYTSSGLLTGRYYVTSHNYLTQPYPIQEDVRQAYIDELFDDRRCIGGFHCSILFEGSPVEVILGSNTREIDFDLDPGASFSGTLTDSSNGNPLVFRSVEVFGSSGNNIEIVNTDAHGFYRTSGYFGGFYFAKTGTSGTHIPELYDNIPCNDCDPVTGTHIALTYPLNTPGIDFALDPIVCNFSDEFNDDLFDWVELKPSWTEANDVLIGRPSKNKAVLTAPASFASCDICNIDTNVSTSADGDNKIWILTHRVDNESQVEILLKSGTDKIVVKIKANGLLLAKAKNNLVIDAGVFYKVIASYDGDNYTVSVDGVPLISIPITALQAGTIGYQTLDTTISVENVCVK